jgi:hypothetical protein
MRTTDQIFLFRSITKHWEPGSDGFIWIDVVVDGDGRVLELHLGGMHDIAPKGADSRRGCRSCSRKPRCMTMFGHGPDARKERCCVIEGPPLSGSNTRMDGLIRLREGRLRLRRSGFRRSRVEQNSRGHAYRRRPSRWGERLIASEAQRPPRHVSGEQPIGVPGRQLSPAGGARRRWGGVD